MDSSHTHKILPTNATSAANPLASTTPTAIARDTVIQTNREGEPPEYREVITTEKVLQPTTLEHVPPSPPPSTTTTTTKTTTIEEIPSVKTTTTVVEEVPTSAEYVIKPAGAFNTVPVNPPTETIVTEPTTKKITTTIETTK